ncbi:transthyretin-like family protein [Calycomorphotria hydatis]|uniref:Carboxypeptidase regulatory-like domain-containing protein n=1 Tax=Calycomorphotria hydatis TaxID=2528027 RepID=A0A517T6K5_9PLAN|nr:hypothetical protein [Calycomorphotria hydatis]QDT64012.1 hypothetical protein V22_12420 [Calycomorphotria hydatis]
MHAKSSLVSLVLSTLITCALSGCGSDTPPLEQVTGIVTLDGKPVEGAIVRFHPELGRVSIGVTNEEGVYELRYTSNASGSLIGKHDVTISKHLPDPNAVTNEDNEPPTVEIIPSKYTEPGELTAEVVEGENQIDFALVSN